MVIQLSSNHSLHFGAFRRNRMKTIILLLICLAVVTITQAGHHNHDRRETNRDQRKENNAHDRSQDNRQDSREINRQDTRQDNRWDNRLYSRDESKNGMDRQDSREISRQDTRQDNRRDNRDYSRDESKDGMDRQDSKENNKQDKRRDNRRDNRRDGRNDDRQNNRQSGRQDRRQDNSDKIGAERRQDSRENNGQREDRIQDSRANNEQQKRQNSWQENKQPWRDIVIENHGKIVNNGGQRDGQQRYTQKQELLNQLGYIQTVNRTKTTGIETLQKQKFLLSMLLNVNDAQTELELEELGQTLLLDEQKYTGSFDDDMRHLVQLCLEGKMLQKTETFNGFDPVHLRQLQGLYKLLVCTRDWDTFQRNACFARLHLNRVLFVNALILAVKEHRETQQLIMPAMNEILPELFYDKQLLQISRTIDLVDLVTVKPELMDVMERGWRRPGAGGNTNAGQQRWGGMQPKKTWQEWRQEKIDRQVGAEPTQTIQNDLRKLILATETVDTSRSKDLDKRISYLTQDVGLSNFWYSLNLDCLRQMRLSKSERKEMVGEKGLISDKQQNKEAATINDGQLLHSNQRRWKQKHDLATVELEDKRLKGWDEFERQRQADDRKDSQRINSRQDSGNEDKSQLKANQARVIVDALLRFLTEERLRLGTTVATSKSQGIQEGLSKTNNENERLLKVNRRRLNADSYQQEQSRENRREKDDYDSNKQLRLDGDEKIGAMRGDQIDGNLLLKTNREIRQRDRDESSKKADSHEDNGYDSIEDERLLKINRRRLNTRNMLGGDKLKITQRLRKLEDSSEELRQDSEEKIIKMLKKLQDSSEERTQNSDEYRRQDSGEQSRQIPEQQRRQNSNEESGMQQRSSMDGERMLGVNRRWLNRRNMLRTIRDNLSTVQKMGKLDDASEKRQQDSEERRRQDTDERSRQGSGEQSRQILEQQRRQNSNEESGMQQRNSMDGERMLGVNRRWLNRRNMLRTIRDNLSTVQKMGKLEDASEERQQDSEERRRQDTDERRRQDSDEQEINSVDEQRLNKINRRRLNTRNMLGEDKNNLKINKRLKKQQDSSEERGQDSDEHGRQSTGEQSRQIPDQQRRQDTDEELGIDGERMLRVNRRWVNKRNMLRTLRDNLSIDQKMRKLEDSSEERHRNSDLEQLQDSDEQRRQGSNENIGILGRNAKDNERLLRVNQRRLNTRNMLENNLDDLKIAQRLRKLQDSSEERRQDSDVSRKQDSEEEMDTLKRNSINDERLLRVNRRRFENKSIWPQQHQDSQLMDQSREDRQDSDEIMRQDSKEGFEILKPKQRRVSEDSSRQEDAEVQQQSSAESSEESREQLNRAPTNARLLAISRRRLPRDVNKQLGEKLELTELRSGEMKLTNMQQMLARLRMERLSHQLEQLLSNKQQLSDSDQQRNSETREGERNIETRDNRQLLRQIQNVEHILQTIIDEELQLLTSENDINFKQSNVLEIIGRIMTNSVSNSDLDIFQIWSHLMQVSADDSNSLMSNMAQQLREPAFSFLMQSILKTVNIFSDKLPSYDSQLLTMDDVQLTDIKVDKLQTYFDTSDADLINTLDQDALRKQNIELNNIRNIPVMRQQRLNHKSFSIKLDIASKRANSVVIRIFLGPKFDSNGNELALNENRRNFMLLDAFRADVFPGQNSIKRKSSDISWTSRDSTPLTQIYREVMQAVDGFNDLQLDRLTGNNQRFPHRLLLPRGLPQGLPMQLFIIVTPQSELDALLQKQLQTETAVLGMGTAAIGLDTLPLGFPLDRRIENVQNILVPNAMLRDISIYHDGEIDI